LKDDYQVIWDGISFEWAVELYPKIYEVENSMRKLISKFMLNKLGIGWHSSSVPKDVEKSIKKENYKLTHGVLYEVDFIELLNFLIKPYSFKDSNKLPDVITEILKKGLDAQSKQEIQDYIPINNWDRYFSPLIDCESEELAKKWKKLYDIRCKVAHNKFLDSQDYESANKLYDELIEIIEKATGKLKEIKIPEKEKESILLHTMGTINEPTRIFINDYNKINSLIVGNPSTGSLLFSTGTPISNILSIPNKNNIIISDSLRSNLFSIENQKNSILSGSSFVSFDELQKNNFLFNNAANSIVTLTVPKEKPKDDKEIK